MSILQQIRETNAAHHAYDGWLPPSMSGRWAIHGLAVLALLGALWFAYADSIRFMSNSWVGDDNYGHALFVPFIVAYLVYLKRSEIGPIVLQPSWWGVLVIVVGGALFAIGELAAVYSVLHVSLWIVIVGLCLSIFGLAASRHFAFPLAYLLTMIPLPQFLYQGISNQLQLISTALGVGCLQFVGITAFQEGNVIDLGPIQLQVIDACSGLRYVFPLVSLSLLCAYLFKGALWKRLVLFSSTIPIAILLNGSRIGIIGVLVELYGEVAAQGFYHLFEGWIFFVFSLAILLGEMWLLGRIGHDRHHTSIRDLLALRPLDSQRPSSPGKPFVQSPRLAHPFLCGTAIVILLALWSGQVSARDEIIPPRDHFNDFPMKLGFWSGSPFPLEQAYIDRLRFHDYLLADYRAQGEHPLTLYVAYYQSQKKGQSAHSPKTCIPGGGWEIASFRTILGASHAPQDVPHEFNRVLIQKGTQRQLVYYWFKQRERQLTNEYLVKLFIFWDALTRQRTDGALIRLTTDLSLSETEADADRRLQSFAGILNRELTRFVPD